MKRILSLLCALALLVCAVPASAGNFDLDYCFQQVLSLHSLMLEKAGMSALYGGGTADEINAVKSALSAPVQQVQVLQYSTHGMFTRFMAMLGEDEQLLEMSDRLRASYEKSIPNLLLSQYLGQFGATSLAAASMLSTGSTGLAPGITQDALVLLDFGTDYHFVCTFTPVKDGIVSASATPLPAGLDIVSVFCQLFELSQDDVQVYTGDALYRKSANAALKEYADSLKDSLISAAAHLPLGIERTEIYSTIDHTVLALYRPATVRRVRLLPLSKDLLPAGSAAENHALLSHLTTTFNALASIENALALSCFSVSDCFDMPRSMPDAAVLQIEYDVSLDGETGTYSVVCVFTPTQQGSVLGSAHFVINWPEVKFMDTLTNGEFLLTFDPALLIELEP